MARPRGPTARTGDGSGAAVRQRERRAVRRAVAVTIGFTAGVLVLTLAGIALVIWLDGDDARAGVAMTYDTPESLPVCGSLGDLAAPEGVTASAPPTATPGEYLGVRLDVAGSGSPQPLSVVVALGDDIVGEYRGRGPSDPSAVVLAGCSADPAADTNPIVPGARPLLPPGDYELVVVFGDDLPLGDDRTYSSPDHTALRLPLTVVGDTDA